MRSRLPPRIARRMARRCEVGTSAGLAVPVIHQYPGPVVPSGSTAVGTPIQMVLVIPGTATSSERVQALAIAYR